MDAHGRTTIEVRPLEALAVEFVSSWHYVGGVLVDEFRTVDGLTSWISIHQDRLGLAPGAAICVHSPELAQVIRVREAIRDLLDAIVDSAQPRPAALRLISEESRQAHMASLIWPPSGPQLHWPSGISTAELLIAQVCASAVRLLSSPRCKILRRCPAPRCVLFFTALRPGQTWCSQACGNRARVARHAAPGKVLRAGRSGAPHPGVAGRRLADADPHLPPVDGVGLLRKTVPGDAD